ncbi:MAG: hypothetical protein KDD44_07525 [Bdellovibrionales bacterium]|nr:hypothetical protein [Bdellovibrionales bacterium]
MPTYEYEREDGSRFEYFQKITDDALTVCPTTGQKVKRLVSAAAFHLKGSGWYKTDYGSNGSSSSASSSSSTSSSSAKSESSSDSKTDSAKSGGCGGSCACSSDSD